MGTRCQCTVGFVTRAGWPPKGSDGSLTTCAGASRSWSAPTRLYNARLREHLGLAPAQAARPRRRLSIVPAVSPDAVGLLVSGSY